MNMVLNPSEAAYVADLMRFARSQQKCDGCFQLYLPDFESIVLILNSGASINSYRHERDSGLYRLELKLDDCIFAYAQPLPFLGAVQGH